jgi:HK97 family phage major capsid protein
MAELKAMMEERKQLLKDMQELHTRDEFGATEREQWERMDARYVELDKSIEAEARALKTADRAKALSERMYTARPDASSSATRSDRDMFARALITGDMSEYRATIVNTHTGVSNAPVPTDMQRRIVELANKQLVLRNLATVYQVASDQQITIDASTPTGYLVDEYNTTTDNYAAPTHTATDVALTFSRLTIKDYAYVCRVPVTKFAYADYIGGGDYLARKVSEGVYLAEEDKFFNGDGSASATGNPGQPKGLVTAITGVAAQKFTATAGSSGDGLTTIAATDVIGASHKILPRYRRNLNWVISDAAALHLRTLKDSNGRFLWQVSDNVTEGLTNGMAGALYGVPVQISEFMPTATAAGTCHMVCGNFAYCEIFDRGPLEFEVDRSTDLKKLSINLQAWKRSDIAFTNTAAFAALVLK